MNNKEYHSPSLKVVATSNGCFLAFSAHTEKLINNPTFYTEEELEEGTEKLEKRTFDWD